MKIGDKVRFLDSMGGGIVKEFKGKDIVVVDDDGFDTPVLIKDCVVIEPANDAQVRKSAQPTVEVRKQAEINRPMDEIREIVETKEGEQLNVLLAYLPVDIKKLSTTDFECYLVNDSNYYLSYSYMSRSNDGWDIRSAGTIEPNTKVFLEEFDKSVLNDMEHVALQFIAYKANKPFLLKNPCLVEVRIDTVKFYKLHSFRDNDYFDDEALIYPAVKNDLPVKELVISAPDIERSIMNKDPRPRIQPIVKKEKDSKPDLIEVDLHIDELIDTTQGLSPADILEYQLRKFREVMDENARHKGQKIVFIHGKGDGVLKNSILKELKTNYRTVYYQDASFREYGYGATMVTIK